MPVSFDWDFEEENADPSSQREGVVLPDSPQRNWRLLGVALFVLLVVGGLSVRLWLNYRLSAIADVEADLRKLVQLELQHIANGDAELLRYMQDPSVFRWRSRQVERYTPDDGGGFVPAPGLAPADRAPQINNVRVVGRSGRVELTHWFQAAQVAAPSLPRWFPSILPAAADAPLPLPFHVTWFYRLDQDGVWYHTAPPDDYVGIPYSWYGTRLDIHATEIEAETLFPVAGDVASLTLRACRLLGCEDDEHYVIDLDDSPQPRLYGNHWSLPALYLAGLPDNQVAHDAWSQALKLWLVETLARSRAGNVVTERVLYQRLLTRLRAELDLGAAPALDVETLALILDERKPHSFQSLWEVEYDPDDPKGNRLLDAEIDALLHWVEEQVGTARLFELLPALNDYSQLDNALLALYHLAPDSFEVEWFSHLFELTGVPPLPPSALPVTTYPALDPPPTSPLSLVSAGEQVAFICDGRVWASNADGSNRVPLTALGQRFNGLYWSPDGRWLLTTWQHGIDPGGSALYLLAADGSSGRLLTNDPALAVFPVGWSADSRQAVYFVRYDIGGVNNSVELWAIDVETGTKSHLPGKPVWSPDGQRLAYVAPASDQGIALWIADGDGQNAYPVSNWKESPPFKVERGDGQNSQSVAQWGLAGVSIGGWSPDGSRLALNLISAYPEQNAVALYDLATASVTPLITIAELNVALASAAITVHRDLSSAVFDPAILGHTPLQYLSPAGWSADGNQFLAWGQANRSELGRADLTALVALALDGAPPRLLTWGDEGIYGDVAWSPTNSTRFTLSRLNYPDARGVSNAYHIFDLHDGSIYTATQSWDAAWSPDGNWAAFSGLGAVTIVDQDGRAPFALGRGDLCTSVAWNPVADLSNMNRAASLSFPVTSQVQDWRFTNTSVYHNQLEHSLRVWGELVNHTGSDQRILSLLPIILDSDGNTADFNQPVTFSPQHRELIRSVSLAAGQSLPFDLTIAWPQHVELGDDYTIEVFVVSEPGQPLRRDLDVIPEELGLSGPLNAPLVSGLWQNNGTGLLEYAALVVTLYDEEGRMVGWGWYNETTPYLLTHGTHAFDAPLVLSDSVTDLNQVYSYQVQLLAR